MKGFYHPIFGIIGIITIQKLGNPIDQRVERTTEGSLYHITLLSISPLNPINNPHKSMVTSLVITINSHEFLLIRSIHSEITIN